MQVLGLLWNLAHRDDCPTDTMDHALNAHLKILDYSCSQVTYCVVMYSRTCTVYYGHVGTNHNPHKCPDYQGAWIIQVSGFSSDKVLFEIIAKCVDFTCGLIF